MRVSIVICVEAGMWLSQALIAGVFRGPRLGHPTSSRVRGREASEVWPWQKTGLQA